jgi:hypothetical protein
LMPIWVHTKTAIATGQECCCWQEWFW